MRWPILSTRRSRKPRSRNWGTKLKLKIDHLSQEYPSRGRQPALLALDDISLTVEPGEILVVLGPSGCGKSTLLNVIAGLLKPTRGDAVFEGLHTDPRQPFTAVVFQEFALFPWRTVQDNVAFGLQMLRTPAAETAERVRHHLRLVGLEAFADRHPHQLSGGMKQRVSIARALAVDPVMLVMDEPLSALDAQTRTILQGELVKLWAATHKSIFYVTHNIEEAVFLAHRIVILSRRPGRIREIVPIPIPHPRDEHVRALPVFGELVEHCWSLIRNEAAAALEDSTPGSAA
jgi:NitT/TauT family transport system ATP-binding protein